VYQPLQRFLSFNERGFAKIGIVQPQQIECKEYRSTFPIEQLLELRAALGIEADNLPV